MTELRTECLEVQIDPATFFANHPEAPLREITTSLLAESELLEYRPDQDRKSQEVEVGLPQASSVKRRSAKKKLARKHATWAR